MALNNYKVLGQISTGDVSNLVVNNHALTSNVVSLTTPVPHNLKAGDRVYITGNTNSVMNGSFLAASISSSAVFTYPRTNANISSAATTSTSLTTLTAPIGLAVTNKAKSTSIATLTVSSTTGISAGDYIDVYINDASFDGSAIRVYDVPNSTTLRYFAVGADVASSAVSSGALSAYAAQTVYTVPSGKEAIAASINISNVNNIGLPGRIALYLVLSGESGTPNKSLILPWTDLLDGELVNLTLGTSISSGDKIVVRGLIPGLSITVTGTELSL